MAQRTAFLNSDAKWYNKDFHHTWISNYMLKQPWVMFSNYSTKPEFALGNWQIAWGKAIIRCTRTTGTFAGEEILACFESTATESISTSWNKKVFIEIPQVYVNDSTAITDTLTWWANLWVWRIVSDSDYPSHTNYIPLWEISNGDWQNATDVRPEVLRRGKPNTISYFGWNWEEERIDIDNSSLNKYLMSNWAWVAPSWEEWGGWGGWSGENFKRTFTADEDLLAKSMFWVETLPTVSNIDASIEFWTTEIEKLFFTTILNWEDFSSIVLNLKSVNSPSDSLSIRIETLDANWKPSWTLVDVWAYGTVSPTSTATDTTISLSGTVTWLTAHTKVAVVISRSWTASDSNYYELWCLDDTNVITAIQEYDGSVWSGWYVSGCITCAWFASDAVVQATSLNWVEWTWYCETWATAGNDFTWILQGTVDYTWATTWTKYYLSSTGVLSTTWTVLVWYWVEDWVLKIESWTTINWECWALSLKTVNSQSLIWSWNIQIEWQKTYDAIVASDGSWDYTTIYAAVTAWKYNLFIKNWNYTETEKLNVTWWYLQLIWESRTWVNVSISASTGSWAYIELWSSPKYLYIKNINFNITLSQYVWYLVNESSQFFLRIESCDFTYSKTWESRRYLLYCTSCVDWKDFATKQQVWSWVYDCTFYTESDTITIWYWDSYFVDCKFTTWESAWEIWFRYWDNVLKNCRINAYKIDWWDYQFSNCYIKIKNWWLIQKSNSSWDMYQFDIEYIYKTEVIIWNSLQQTIRFQTWHMDKCHVKITDSNMTLSIWWNIYENQVTYTANSFIEADWHSVEVYRSMFNCRVNCSSLTLGGGNMYMRYNWIFTEASTVTFESSGSQYTWIVLDWWSSNTPWTLSITCSYSMITWNSFRFYTISDSWTDNIKANNVWQS